MFIDTSQGQPGDVANLKSKGFVPSYRDECLTFWYVMIGQASLGFNVYFKIHGDQRILKMSRQGKKWASSGKNQSSATQGFLKKATQTG